MRPLLHVAPPNAMLYLWPFHRDDEFGRWLDRRRQGIGAKLTKGQSHCFIKRFGSDLDGMRQRVGVDERDPALLGGHGGIISVIFAFCSP